MRNYRSIIIFGIGAVVFLGFFNWPYWQAVFFPRPSPPLAQHEQNQNYLLKISKINVAAPVIFPQSNEEEVLQQALQNGVAHYAGTALPGEIGNVYIVGHSSDNPWAKGNYKNVFANLPKLKSGDRIEISRGQNSWVYEIFETKVISPKDLSVLDQPADQKLLTLQTSYPIGTSLRRYMVVAKLTR